MPKEDNNFGTLGVGELRPGVTPRRWEPEEGVKKLNDRIHKESKFADDNKNLPFSFSKPKKARACNTALKCNNCGNISYASRITVGVICKACGKFSTVSEV